MTEHGILVAGAFVGIGVLLGAGFVVWAVNRALKDLFD